MDTALVAEQFEISRRRVQQLAKRYRNNSEFTGQDTGTQTLYGVSKRSRRGGPCVAPAPRRWCSRNRSRSSYKGQHLDHIYPRPCVTDNPNKQSRQRPWVRFEREYAGVTVQMDWYHNEQGQQVLEIEDDASRRVFDMIEPDSSSASKSVKLLDSVHETLDQFLAFYNKERPHMSLNWDNLETPIEAFDRLQLSPMEDLEDPLATEVNTDE